MNIKTIQVFKFRCSALNPLNRVKEWKCLARFNQSKNHHIYMTISMQLQAEDRVIIMPRKQKSKAKSSCTLCNTSGFS